MSYREKDVICEFTKGNFASDCLKYNAEDLLDIYAHVLKIDRMEESSFDSDDFPKIIFHSDDLRGVYNCEGCQATT